MKYGDYFEAESVPRWSLHNIDYNSLKHLIRLHTTKGQATAIAIPGQVDHALERFENDFYQELCRQHDRVGLFVASKADEISRRLKGTSGLINTLILRCAGGRGVTPKRQRRFLKYQQDVVECGDDIRDLQRFVRAQVEAFRKIMKKYKKWTGSTTLTARFTDNVLCNYKSFTKRDFHPLQLQYRDILTTIQAASPGIASPVERPGSSDAMPDAQPRGSRRSSLQHSRLSSQTRQSRHIQVQEPAPQGWNEYDNGSEAGDEYYIELDPDDSGAFPGLETMKNVLGAPVRSIRGLFSRSSGKDAERQPLMNGSQGMDYFSARPSTQATDTEATEDEDASSAEFPVYGFAAHYAALPSIEEQRVERFKETVLHRSIVLSYVGAIILTVIAGVLVATGRHRLRLEVDAGVILAVVASLFAGCMGLGAMLYRQDSLSFLYQAAVWMTFVAVCLLNGMLLILVVGSNGLTP
ncbi:hypothetical protein JX265_004263 [Neoarthrinium moseri]|uniref:SPX domain-containing protein n=1 Tax=Neoarthrinium moseri TaxID=1658444 RepID=A0A9Q0AR26_9PEZI|nr:uncharacterized protein JN550_001943 [Neoarthrinium moseri]KAI1850553.1 hypothetical protein JX266_003835 [Neoarthrinium moseri]KAI1875205.1 hypothetical protein JX265_004263 [Neoarthrinium moseri]KAI1875657.1 hypothetical protein JN550_001943 [Neoarthrinium moseri]